MNSILISSDRSSGGKTTFTLCLMAAMKKLGYSVQGYKCGPDYIDTGFHSIITENPGRNLDEFLQGREVFNKSLSKSVGDLNIIEGVMGFYDGLNDGKFSAYDISEKLNVPVILIMHPKGQALTFAAVLKGIKDFRRNNIKGVVLSMVSEKYYLLLKEYIEKETDIEVLGYMPKVSELEFSSRHLGLIQGREIENLRERINKGADELLKTVDTGRILRIMKDWNDNHHDNLDNASESEISKNVNDDSKPTAVYALDDAFSFYYRDSLEVLAKHFNMVPFSPLKDEVLPPCSFLYLGGGYPEVYKEKLSENRSLLNDIKEKLEGGLPCYAECGGLMYLADDIDGSPMIGFLPGSITMTKNLQHFGYCRVRLDSPLLPAVTIPAHEFHKSVFSTDLTEATEVTGESSGKSWPGGYVRNNVFAQYAHINLGNAGELLNHFISLAEKYK